MHWNNDYPKTADATLQNEIEAIATTASGLANPMQLFDDAASVSVRLDQTASGAPLVFVHPVVSDE